MPIKGKWKPQPIAQRLADEIQKYPCGVCGEEFRSRRELATHPHEGRR